MSEQKVTVKWSTYAGLWKAEWKELGKDNFIFLTLGTENSSDNEIISEVHSRLNNPSVDVIVERPKS